MAILSGNEKNLDEIKKADFIFAMITMISKPEYLSLFDKSEFSNIVIDEVHHAATNSYEKIMNYFQPEFWLGMTATPDRPDGKDIYELFDHNIACNIRLQQAMEYDLLCPFHYFGITDLEVDGACIDEENLDEFNRLHLDERVKHIVNQMEYYGYDGERVKGLIFCRSLKEASELSRKLNIIKKKDGTYYRTLDLDGGSNEDERIEAISRMVDDDRDDKLDYILTCGIFKGGWEFPGGKIEEGESPQEALIREIKEELDAEINVGELIDTIEYDYPTFHLSMDCFWAEIISGELVLREHEDAKWLKNSELDSVEWLPADIRLIDKIKQCM